MTDAVDAALTRAAREEGGRVLALLAHRFGDVDLADEAVQEALIEAATAWPERGIPDNPGGWLHTVARRKAIDLLRRRSAAARRDGATSTMLARTLADDDGRSGRPALIDDSTFSPGDEQLRLMLLCCHPALDRDTQIVLTLRLVGGLTTPEIAAAFLVPEPTLAQRIVRAKRKIRDAGIPLSMPASLDERIGAVLTVLYLVFNEGYLAHGATPEIVRVDLIDEAIRLTSLVGTLLPEHVEVEGLLALQLFHRARGDGRTDGHGDLVLLEDQDRSRWDLPEIHRANAVLHRALARHQPGPFQVQALIASHHANARTAADTDWPTIAALYRQLTQMDGSPVIALNHAVAVAMADGPHAGLALLDGLDGLDRYHLLHSARGELLLRCGRHDQAIDAFRRASELTDHPAERRHLARRIETLHYNRNDT